MNTQPSAKTSRNAISDTCFPLTPALSLGERENPRQRLAAPGAPRTFKRQTAAHPLPKGKGWGEGEAGVLCQSGCTLSAPSARVLSISLCGLLLLAAAFAGCVSKSQAKAQERAAYIRGQQEAVARIQQAQTQGQGPCITVNGEVRNRVVPWTEGMTLAKAIMAADYCGAADPGQIIVVHNGIARRIELQQLMSGVDVPLQPGDIVQLMQQAPAAAPQAPPIR